MSTQPTPRDALSMARDLEALDLDDIAAELLRLHALTQGTPATGGERRVFIVATGDEHDGEATYTRHDDAPPPLCDSECLYTSPQPVREPLTPERIEEICVELRDTVGCGNKTLARAIEAAHGITGGKT